MAKHEVAGEFVGLMFMSRDIAHREHLGTRSYAVHKALGKFYPGIIDLADDFVEAFQGYHNTLLEIPLLDNEFSGAIDEILEQHMNWIETNRANIIPKTDTALQNIIDEIVGLYASTLYKLRFLS